jgi:hypothetical protein
MVGMKSKVNKKGLCVAVIEEKEGDLVGIHLERKTRGIATSAVINCNLQVLVFSEEINEDKF